jgi:hypothetical protein
LQNWLVSLERTFALLDQPPEIAESPFAIPVIMHLTKDYFRPKIIFSLRWKYESCRSGKRV